MLCIVACQGIGDSPSSQSGEIFLPVDGQIAFVPADCVLAGVKCPTPTKVQFISPPHFTRISDWSADASKALAFAQNSASSKTDLFILKPHDLSPQFLTSMAYLEDAQWSPDGKSVAIIGVKDGDPKTAGFTENQIRLSRLYLLSSDGAEMRDLTGNLTGRKHDLSWLDQNTILFEVYTAFDNCGLYKVNTLTSEQNRLTEPPTCDIAPAPSPDGTKIAFVDNDTAHGPGLRVFVMNSSGLDVQPVTEFQGIAVYPQWSKDGKWIILRSVEEHLEGAIYVVRPDGAGLQKIYQEKALIYEKLLPPPLDRRLLILVRSNMSGQVEKWVLLSIPDGKQQEILLPRMDQQSQPEWISWRPAQSVK